MVEERKTTILNLRTYTFSFCLRLQTESKYVCAYICMYVCTICMYICVYCMYVRTYSCMCVLHVCTCACRPRYSSYVHFAHPCDNPTNTCLVMSMTCSAITLAHIHTYMYVCHITSRKGPFPVLLPGDDVRTCILISHFLTFW